MADETQTLIDATADATVKATEAVGEAANEATATAVKSSRRLDGFDCSCGYSLGGFRAGVDCRLNFVCHR